MTRRRTRVRFPAPPPDPTVVVGVKAQVVGSVVDLGLGGGGCGPLPRWPGRSVAEVASKLAGESEWLLANDVLPADVVTPNRRLAETALRSWAAAWRRHRRLRHRRRPRPHPRSSMSSRCRTRLEPVRPSQRPITPCRGVSLCLRNGRLTSAMAAGRCHRPGLRVRPPARASSGTSDRRGH
jgi:hypothetical protein